MAADYGSCQNPTNSQITENSSVNNKKPLSYATAAQQNLFPTKEQAIILDSIEGVPIKDYVSAIGGLIGPNNIRFVSRISNNRVCMYLASKEIADTLIEANSNITVGNNSLVIRPLLTKNKRIILSNVCPIIPHHILLQELNKIHVKTSSAISFIRAGISEPGFAHIMSFRRQVYVHPDEVNKLPESLKIEYDNTTYWIYLSTDSVSCFICKQQGHLAKHCPENITEIDNSSSESAPTVINQTTNINDSAFPPLEPVGKIQSSPLSFVKTRNTKRALSDTSSSQTSLPKVSPDTSLPNDPNSSGVLTAPLKNTVTRKKPKRDASLSFSSTDDQLEQLILPLKEILSTESKTYSLDYIQFKSFLEKTKGSSDINEIAREYTDNNDDIISILRNTYPLLKERSIKNRFTRLIKKLSPIECIVNNDTFTSHSEGELSEADSV